MEWYFNLLNGASAFAFHVGANASQTISLTIKDFETSGADASSGVFENIDTAATHDDDSTEDLEGTDISSVSEARQ